MKTLEELNTLKEEVKTLNEKLAKLSEEEMNQVAGGHMKIAIYTFCCEECGYVK